MKRYLIALALACLGLGGLEIAPANAASTTLICGPGDFFANCVIPNSDGSITITGGGGGGPATLASGAVAAGAYSAGSQVDGSDLTQGAKADSACATDTGTCSLIALIKKLAANITSGTLTAGTAGTPSSQFMSVQGGTGMTALTVTPASSATVGGFTSATPIEAGASDNHQNVVTGAHQLYHWNVTNKSGAIQYLRFYDAASGFNGCNSATNLKYEVEIPFQTSNVGGISEDFAVGMNFANGISVCYTGLFGQTDTTAATASSSVINVGYK